MAEDNDMGVVAGWGGHWHGYAWTGTASAYFAEGARRPGHPAFAGSPVPPLMTGHWLMRREQAAPERTWTVAGQALAWLSARYGERPPYQRAGKATYEPLEVKEEYAADALPRGVDVTWAYWVSPANGTLASFSVVACPNRFHPDLVCPCPPNTVP